MTGRWHVSAVLLDMDGTLLDTERVYFDSLVAALNAYGYTDDTATLCQAMVGLPGPDCEAMLHARYGESFPLADVSRAFITSRDEILSAGLPLKSGAVELLDALQAAECPMAIVTSSSLRTADTHLRLAGIRPGNGQRGLQGSSAVQSHARVSHQQLRHLPEYRHRSLGLDQW